MTQKVKLLVLLVIGVLLQPVAARPQTIPAPRSNVDGMAFDGSALYVLGAQLGGRTIDKIDPTNGAVLATFLSPDPGGTFTGSLLGTDLAYDEAGHLFLNDFGGATGVPPSSVVEFDTGGTTVLGSFSVPFRGWGITFDGASLYVGSGDDSDLRVYDGVGTLLRTITLPFRPGAIAYDHVTERLFIEGLLDTTISVVTPAGVVLDSYLGPHQQPQFQNSGIEIIGSSLYIVGATTPGGNADTIFVVGAVCGDGHLQPGEQCDDGNGLNSDGCSSTCTIETGWSCTGVPSVCTPICGDNLRVGPEQCDTGSANGAFGSCCTTNCEFQPAQTACSDDGDLCTEDVCTGSSGACTHPIAPSAACVAPAVPRGASLLLQARSTGHNQAQFKWAKGPPIPLSDLGTPTSDLTRLCVYDEIAPGRYILAMRGAPSVSGGGLWKATSTGWTFKSKTGAPDGISGITLKANAAPLKAKVQVLAKKNPALSSLPLQQSPRVVAQFKTSGAKCWGATFSTATKNTATTFKSKSD